MKLLLKVILVLLILLIIASIALYLFNKLYLSDILASKLTTILKEQTSREVEIKNASFSLVNGLAISEITIFEENSKTAPFLKIDTLYCKISFSPFKKNQILNIPISIDSKNIEIFINRKTQDEFNFSTLKILSQKEKTPKPKSKLTILPSRIQLKNLKLHFKDNFVNPSLSQTINFAIIGAQFQLPSKINFAIEGNIFPCNSQINIKGEYRLPTKNLSAVLNLNKLPIEQYGVYFSNLPLSIQSALLEKTDVEISFDNKLLSTQTNATLKNIDLKNKDLNIKAELSINAHTEYNFSSKKIDYGGNLDIINGSISGVKLIEEIDKINGKIIFRKDLFETKNTTASVLGIPLYLEGRFYEFKNPYLFARIISEFNPSVLTDFFAEKSKGVKLEGRSKIDLILEGRLKEKQPIDYSGSLEISETKITHPYFKMPVNIKNSKILIKENIISCEELNASYENSNLRAKITIDVSTADEAILNSSGDLNIDFSDLNSEKLKLAGLGKAKFDINTKLNDLNNADLNFEINSDVLSLKDIKLQGFSFQYKQSHTQARAEISSNTYNGTTKIIADLTNPFLENVSYQGNIKIDNLDLSKLKKDTPLKNKDFSGIFSSNIEIEGQTRKLNYLTGNGNIKIKNGNIWELKPFKIIYDALKLKSLVKFSQGAATFTIKDKKIATEDMLLTSTDKSIEIAAAGSIGFDKYLDVIVHTKASPEILKEPDITAVPGLLLGAALAQLKLNIYGHWDNLQYRPIIAPLDDIKKVIKKEGERIKGILEDFGLGDILK